MSETGILYVVATPLGNLDDISPRAIQVLRSVDLIFAEDTRHSKKLLNHIGSDRPLLSLFEHNESQRKEKVLQTLGEGQAAIISDAGTPAVSDPGARAVAAAHQAGFKVVPIPGPSALSTALSAAGFSFSAENGGALFLGFLPTKGSERTRILDEIEQNPGVIVLFESPHRITKTLAELALRQPEREAVLARELTKIFEEVVRLPLKEMSEKRAGENERGEMTLVLGPVEKEKVSVEDADLDLDIQRCLDAKMSVRDTSLAISVLRQISKKRVYKRALTISEALN